MDAAALSKLVAYTTAFGASLQRDFDALRAQALPESIQPVIKEVVLRLTVMNGQADNAAKSPTAIPAWASAASQAAYAVASFAKQVGQPTIAAANAARAAGIAAEIQKITGGTPESPLALILGAAAAFGVAYWLFRPGGFGNKLMKKEEVSVPRMGRSWASAFEATSRRAAEPDDEPGGFDTDDEEDAEFEPA